MAGRETSGSSTDDESEKLTSDQAARGIQISRESLDDNGGSLVSCQSLETMEVATESSEQSDQATTFTESAGTGKKENQDSSDTALGSLPTPSTSESSRTLGRSSESGRGTVDLELGRNPIEPVPLDCQDVVEEVEMVVIPLLEDCQVENRRVFPPDISNSAENPPTSRGHSSDFHADNEATVERHQSEPEEERPTCNINFRKCCLVLGFLAIFLLCILWGPFLKWLMGLIFPKGSKDGHPPSKVRYPY